MRPFLLLLLLCSPAFSQVDVPPPADQPPAADPALWPPLPEDSTDPPIPAPAPSAARDSLERALARLAVARADELVAATAFWHKLVPRVQLGASAGIREVVFHDLTGALMLPKDSYRLSATLPLDDLLDGSRHALALLEREQACVRMALLVEQQTRAHELIRLKCAQLDRELPVQRERVLLFSSLAEYHEMLFVQGKIEYPVLLRSRHALLTAQKKLDDLEHARIELDIRRKPSPPVSPK